MGAQALAPEVERLLEELPRSRPQKLDKAAVEGHLRAHLDALGVPPMKIIWAKDGVQGLKKAAALSTSRLGITGDAAYSRADSRLRGAAGARLYQEHYLTTRNTVFKRAWTVDDMSVASLCNTQTGMTGINPYLFTTLAAMSDAVAFHSMSFDDFHWAIQKLSDVWYPIYEAWQDGLWMHVVVPGTIICVGIPKIYHDDARRFHREDGPAVEWEEGHGLFMIHGVTVPRELVLSPSTVNPVTIDQERNVEVRRVMIERIGLERYLTETGTREIARDDRGILYRKELPGDEPIVVVKVRNSTPEPDGTFKDYFLRVPPSTLTPTQGIAWTFGIDNPQDYFPGQET